MSWIDHVCEQLESSPFGDWAPEWDRLWRQDTDYQIVQSLHESLKVAYQVVFGFTDGLYPEHNGWQLVPSNYRPERVRGFKWPDDLSPSVSEELLIEWTCECYGYSAVDEGIRHRARWMQIKENTTPAFENALSHLNKRLDDIDEEYAISQEKQTGMRVLHPFLIIGFPKLSEQPVGRYNLLEEYQRLEARDGKLIQQRHVLTTQKHWLELWRNLHSRWSKSVKKPRFAATNFTGIIKSEDVYRRGNELWAYVDNLPARIRQRYLETLKPYQIDATWVILGHWYLATLARCGATPDDLQFLRQNVRKEDGLDGYRDMARKVKQMYSDYRESHPETSP